MNISQSTFKNYLIIYGIWHPKVSLAFFDNLTIETKIKMVKVIKLNN